VSEPLETAAPSLLALSADEFAARVVALGGRPFHARVARRAVLDGATDYEALTSLPRALREGLERTVPPLAGQETARVVARDRTLKFVTTFARRGARDASVETVWIPAHSRSAKGATLCVSTQVGCPVACPFCASGLGGLARNLEAHEIVEQFVRGLRVGPLSRAVVMGIGEPLLNYANLAAALEVVTDELGIGARKITVSTVGFPERLARAARAAPRFQLAISLHTPDDEQRDELVPAMRGVPIEAVLAAGDDWFAVTGREITYEYVLLGGVNDTGAHAARLAGRLTGRRCTVNLIPFNPAPELPYRRPSPDAVAAFQERLTAAGLVATVRWSRGLDSDAACGQLRVRAGRAT
jgi:23S rRNA (adenine2503-C2)-methyltransferase